MLAFHGDADLKVFVLGQIAAHREADKLVKEVLERRIVAGAAVQALAFQDGPDFHWRAAQGWSDAPPPLTHGELLQVEALIFDGTLEPMHARRDLVRAVLRTVTLGPAPEPKPKPVWLLKRIERNRRRKEAAREAEARQ